jgi:hypothetical protein
VIDAEAGMIVATLPIGARSDGTALDPKRKLIFSSNGDGTLSVIAEKDANSFETVASVTTKQGARTMALDPESRRLYLVAADMTINLSADLFLDPRYSLSFVRLGVAVVLLFRNAVQPLLATASSSSPCRFCATTLRSIV